MNEASWLSSDAFPTHLEALNRSESTEVLQTATSRSPPKR